MKPEHPSSEFVTVEGTPEQRVELGDSNKIHVEKVKSRIPLRYFIKYFLFNAELNVPYSQIYILGLQIIWEWDDHQLPLLQRRIEKIHYIGRVKD